MTRSESMLFDAIITRLAQGGQMAAISILQNWILNEYETTKE